MEGCIDESEVRETVMAYLRQRLISTFNGRVLPCSGSDGWWTGEWHEHTVEGSGSGSSDSHWCWSGDRHSGAGVKTTLSCDGDSIIFTTYYKVTNSGPYHKDEEES